MTIERRAILALRFCLAALFLALLVLQLFSFPGQFAYQAEQDPDPDPGLTPGAPVRNE